MIEYSNTKLLDMLFEAEEKRIHLLDYLHSIKGNCSYGEYMFYSRKYQRYYNLIPQLYAKLRERLL